MLLKKKLSLKSIHQNDFEFISFRQLPNQGLVQFMVYKENMKAGILIRFLEQLIEAQEHKVFLILDNLRVQHSKTVKK